MSQLPLNIYISEKADVDEARLYQYVLRKFGKMYAEKLRSNINDLYRKLSITPTAGRIAKNDRSLRIFIFNRQNKIVYRTTQTDLEVVRILSARRKRSGKY